MRERFVTKYEVGEDGCWLWTGCIDPEGYGRFNSDGNGRLAHRVSYTLFVGPIPAGLELDHLCCRPRCVNPEHLEPVTHRENLLRGDSPSGRHARKTHCHRGHEFTPENTYLRQDRIGRDCRTCAQERELQRSPRRKAAA